MTVAQLLKHDFKSKGPLYLYDSNGNIIYQEFSDGTWCKRDYDSNGNQIYYEDSTEYWYKQDYDNNLTILSLHGIRYKKLNDAIIEYEQSTTLYDHLKMRERDDRYEIIKDIETVCYDFLHNEYTIEEVLEVLSEMGPMPHLGEDDKPQKYVDWAIRYANNVLLDSKDSDTGKK